MTFLRPRASISSVAKGFHAFFIKLSSNSRLDPLFGANILTCYRYFFHDLLLPFLFYATPSLNPLICVVIVFYLTHNVLALFSLITSKCSSLISAIVFLSVVYGASTLASTPVPWNLLTLFKSN